MGTSTDGILFFGIDLGEDEDDSFPWQGEDWEDFAADKLGVSRPEVPWEGNEDVFRKYWKEKAEAIEALECEIGTHCSDSYPCYFVAPKKKVLVAARGYPLEVTKDFLDVDVRNTEISESLKNFCELMEIPWQEPKWHLASYWG